MANPQPPTITATSGGAGDEHHSWFAALDKDIRRFESDSKVPEGLCWLISAPEESIAPWYNELMKAWKKAPPNTLEDATVLVFDALHEVHPNVIDITHLEGCLRFYGLPQYYPLVKNRLRERVENATFFPFRLNTLPVIKNRVKDAGNFTVSVAVKDLRLLPSDTQSMICERREALRKGDGSRASELLKQINSSRDYEIVKSTWNEELVTKKYQIRLRGIAPPEIAQDYGPEARDELRKMIGGKCLTISVFYIDVHRRCVADAYCENTFVQVCSSVGCVLTYKCITANL
ncbi:staphylococcal-like nuclease CAN1 isoform X1 [Bidens hawaiensis]|uniref:staphylococcal-like nuclease CAN1 isoform X1 n=1 Tax=Bidens hawaiensis TaxID=980011 RepID=UPI00404917A3